jgi:Ser/Thr protein kinase RdoA (MazF antagonist)
MAREEETKYFYELTPEKILSAVEETEFRCTGRILTLNSMENRVYEVEIEVPDEDKLKSISEKFRIAKFYRPGRWSKDQILEEHRFLQDLEAQDIPVITPIKFEDGTTLKKTKESDIYFAVFPKCGGRIPEEFNDQQLEIIGRLLARLHNVGASKKFKYRLELTPETYGLKNLEFLLSSNSISLEVKKNYEATVREIAKITGGLFRGLESIRIHGDCHLANILWGNNGPFLVDFDDTLSGPPVQDLWLILPGRDEEAQRQLDVMLTAYESMRHFDRASLKLIEGLRALRIIHFSAWIAKRWKDPAFQRAFTEFGTERYWQEQLATLNEQLSLISN